jgi:hypothetical protein
LLAKHDLAREEGADPQRDERARREIRALAVAYAENALANSSSEAPEGEAEDREGDVAPVGPRAATEASQASRHAAQPSSAGRKTITIKGI